MIKAFNGRDVWDKPIDEDTGEFTDTDEWVFSGGDWLSEEDYEKWLEKHGDWS